MQQRPAQLRAHPLPQRQLPQRRLHDVPQVQRRRQLVQPPPIAPLVNAVNVAQEVERIANRHVPPELHPLPEHRAEAAHMCLPLRPRRAPIHRTAAACRRQNARHQLDERAFARAVRPNQPDEFPAPNAEGYVPERLHLARFPPPQARDAAMLRLLPPDVGLCQPVCHNERRICPLLFHALPPLDVRWNFCRHQKSSAILPRFSSRESDSAALFFGRCRAFSHIGSVIISSGSCSVNIQSGKNHRISSYIMMAAAIAAFRLSAPPRMGRRTRCVAVCCTCSLTPLPSLPMTRANCSATPCRS